MDNKAYIGTYKVVRVFKKSHRREVIARGLNLDHAKLKVSLYKERPGINGN